MSKNHIPVIHRLVTDEKGENYWFDGCACYVMECLGEPDYDYVFFAGLTGDVFAQYYPRGEFRGEGVSSYMLREKPYMYLRETENRFELCRGEKGFAEQLFDECGYSSEFVPVSALCGGGYTEKLRSYIDMGVPVIACELGEPYDRVIVGYEDGDLLYITGNSGEPRHISLERSLDGNTDTSGWIFVGEKTKSRPLAEIYRKRIITLHKLLSTETDRFSFGAGAFRAWAEDIENEKFDAPGFDPWKNHGAYVCGLATNASCCGAFLDRALTLNPDMGFLRDIKGLYRRCGKLWNNDNGSDLEAMGCGLSVTSDALRNNKKRFVSKLRELADINDEIAGVLKRGVETL